MIYFPIEAFSRRFGDKFFTFEIKSFTVKRGENECSCLLSEYIVYNLNILAGKKSWIVEKRFSDFEKLLVYFVESYPYLNNLPILPSKTFFNVLNDKNFLEERKKKLAIFFHDFLLELTLKNVLTDHVLLEFLELKNNNHI
jgi:hypothetical protein